MAFMTDADLFYEAMDPSQFMFWDKEDRPYYYMNSYEESDSDSEAIPGTVLSEMVKSQKARRDSQGSMKETHMCKFFLRGNCRYGSQCRFKHTSGNHSGKQTEHCVFFLRGYCRYGNSCHFRHTIMNEAIKFTPKQEADKASSNLKCSDFSPSDDDVSAGRLTRVRVCFDLPVSGSVPWDKPNGHSSYFIEVFVDKREDDVQYLYNLVEKKVSHPFYCSRMFELQKPGTNLDLSDKSIKLKDTSIFLFGSCVDALLIQSYNLASKVLRNETLQDPQRYTMSKLPRNADGSFKEINLKTQLKCFPEPESEESTSIKPNQDSPLNDNNELACLYEMQENVGKLVRIHDEKSCSWCSEKGCMCLANSDCIESDDSELSYQSKNSDTRKTGKNLSPQKESFECGTYPDSLNTSSIPANIQLKFGDIISFGEYPKATFYAVGNSSKLIKLQSDDLIHIPIEISHQVKDPIRKYKALMGEKSSKIGDTIAVAIRNDDPVLLSCFDGSLSRQWKCSALLKRTSSKNDVNVHCFRIEVEEHKCFDAVASSSELANDGSFVTRLAEICQR